MLKQKLSRLVCGFVLICAFGTLLPGSIAVAQDDADVETSTEIPIWQAADDIRGLLLDAQRELFAAGRADDPTENHQTAAEFVIEAQTLYESHLQPDVLRYAPAIDEELLASFGEAQAAAETGAEVDLARARGNLWTGMLNASYQTTLAALDSSDLPTVERWLRLREYRQATRVTIVLSPAARALSNLEAGTATIEETRAVIDNDLRDSYYFRLRDAMNELQAAIETDYGIRAAEWLGQLEGYFTIFAPDYAAQFPSADAPQSQLAVIETSLAKEDSQAALDALTAFRTALVDYQPVTLTASQIAERGQLLYIFTDLVYIEYKDGVRGGEITVPIEYQEATTFLSQARSTFEELRPTIADNHPDNAVQLGTLLDELNAAVTALDEPSRVQELVNEAKGIVSGSLEIDLNGSTAAAFTLVNTLLDDAEASIADGRYESAEQSRLQAYALFDFGPEQRLMAFDPNLAFAIDGLFWHGSDGGTGLARVIAARNSVDDFKDVRKQLTDALDEAQLILGTTSQPLTIIVNSAIIVFREGLEAVVIIAALSAGMVRANRKYRRPLFAGAFGALIVSGITWFIADAFLSLFRDYGERLEAVVSLVALGVLLVITNWFFHKVYWTDHLANFHQRKSRLISGEAGRYLGLIILGFTSIYREGFETVLFLQALVLDAGVLTVLQGVLLGLFAVGIVGFITFRLQTRLPYMKMMVATGIMIGGVLLMLVGSTVRVLQVVAWLPVHPIEGVSFPHWWGQWFGVYPTWEGIGAQLLAAAFVIGSYFLAERMKSKQRQTHVPSVNAAPTTKSAQQSTSTRVSQEAITHGAD